jgi:acetoin utilization deacetylase AcuC-like enzyme
MGSDRATAVVEDSRFAEHRSPAGHPECPERLDAVHRAVDERRSRLESVPPREATPDEILRIHARDLWDTVSEASRRAPAHLDPDTYVSPESFDVARLAAGGTVDLVRRVARGDATAGLAAVRPPGHHAEAGRAMGFCLFNNVAIAARALQAEDGVERVLIFDWDVHHGNGTQHSFDDDPHVLYASTHQFPFYPGTGDFHEMGRGAGLGSTLNVPMPAGCGDAEFVGVAQRLLAPAARHFRPEMILVSCGFDAHRDDPLGAMKISDVGFRALTTLMRALADDLCGGRIAFVLEGGYSPIGLFEGTGAVLDVLLGKPQGLPEPVPLVPGSVLEHVVERVVGIHGSRIPDLGAA